MRKSKVGKGNNFWLILGESILLASIQVSLASVEMSSRFSVLNFSKTEEILQNASNALTGYLVIGTIFMIGSVLTMTSLYGRVGFLTSVLSNFIIMGWITSSYILAFKSSSEKYNIPFPKLFSSVV